MQHIVTPQKLKSINLQSKYLINKMLKIDNSSDRQRRKSPKIPSGSRSRSGKRKSKIMSKIAIRSNNSSKILKFGALTPSSIANYVTK